MIANMTATEVLGAFQLGLITGNEARKAMGFEEVETTKTEGAE